MALQMSYTAPFRTVFPTAYFRVAKIDLQFLESRAWVEVWVYPDQATRQLDDQATVARLILRIEDVPGTTAFTDYFGVAAQNVQGMNARKAAYNYLKTLGSYSGATDVND